MRVKSSTTQTATLPHSYTKTEHMVHTHVHTLSLRARWWNLQSRSIFLLLLAGVALQDVLLPSLSPIFLLTQILVRTDLGDEPDGPRTLRSGLCETCDLDHSDRHSTCGKVFCVLTSPLPRTAQECREGCDEDDDRAGHAGLVQRDCPQWGVRRRESTMGGEGRRRELQLMRHRLRRGLEPRRGVPAGESGAIVSTRIVLLRGKVSS